METSCGTNDLLNRRAPEDLDIQGIVSRTGADVLGIWKASAAGSTRAAFEDFYGAIISSRWSLEKFPVCGRDNVPGVRRSEFAKRHL